MDRRNDLLRASHLHRSVGVAGSAALFTNGSGLLIHINVARKAPVKVKNLSRIGIMEAIMAEQSSMHSYLEWTKQRIDEMDAVLASLESKAGQIQADSRAKAEQVVAELKKQRDAFQAKAKTHVEGGEAALKAAEAQLEVQWNGFEAQVKAYFETAAKQLDQQQATFRQAAAAQAKAWGEAVGRFHTEATKLAAAKRSEVDAAVNQMKAQAAQADAALEKLKQGGNESWTTLSGALAESRKAFDRATHEAWDAFMKAVPHKS